MAHRRQGYRFDNDWKKEDLEEYLINIESGTALPVNVEIKMDQAVLSFDTAKQYLTRARKISLMDCFCRVTRRNCNAPVNTCMDLNEIAERNIAKGTAREITLEEALDVLARTHEAGLVHMAYVKRDPAPELGGVNSICSCCSCCCSFLATTLRFGLAPHVLKSYAVSVTDSSKCAECGVCSDRCQFGARTIVNGSLEFKPSLCFGCGLCVSKCPAGAITIVNK
jgi:ferredoxin